jgi:hypothetical protein
MLNLGRDDGDKEALCNCPGSRESWMSGARDVVVLGFGGAV